MKTRQIEVATRWLLTFVTLAAIVLVYYRWLHVNPTTVALTLVLYVLLVAARLSLRYAVVASVAAAFLYNYYFLPPVGTLTISDPENWLALFSFLATSVIGSRLSQTARDEADHARLGQRELQVLFTLSRDLLRSDNVAELTNALPSLINVAVRADSTALFLLEGDRLYQAGSRKSLAVELPHLRQQSLVLQSPEILPHEEVNIPLRAGVRPRGLLRVSGIQLSTETLQAVGGLVSIALDRAQALEEVAHSEATKESERMRTLILDSITHELRTPLTSIKGATSTLLSTPDVSESDRQELLAIVDEEADRLNLLVSQALEMAQIETQEVHMTFAPVDLREIVTESLKSCAWVGVEHPISVELPAALPVIVDRVMIGKVLCNLLENAAKYSAAGSPIYIGAEKKDRLVNISVADRGIGIDPAEQPLIFDRLYRSHTQSEKTPGTGMGLAISRAIVEAHHGVLGVTSQLEHGSVFSFSLLSAPENDAL